MTKNAYLRSDNAGCYHSAETILSLRQLSKDTGITIRRFDFSDPQGGKGPSDRYAAVIKSHIRRYLNEGHDVLTAAQFITACNSYGGVKNVHAFECQLTSRSKNKLKINDIIKLHNFIYETIAIRSNRAWNVGTGKMIILDGSANVSSKINSLVCVNPSPEPARLINSSADDHSDGAVFSVLKDSPASYSQWQSYWTSRKIINERSGNDYL
ncbi:unnamed protein product [Adineta steineri]|uniref:Uncharacterized protein n=1 Tax=Adineta steineri TaxID=433720 RepID=A0A814DD77_9BILA|nr:unnamed protein product [Adineta steineri]CAF1191234.1 unnamed protein product [Adineta steineri]